MNKSIGPMSFKEVSYWGPFYVLVSTGIEIYLLDTLHLIKSEYFNMDSL